MACLFHDWQILCDIPTGHRIRRCRKCGQVQADIGWWTEDWMYCREDEAEEKLKNAVPPDICDYCRNIRGKLRFLAKGKEYYV